MSILNEISKSSLNTYLQNCAKYAEIDINRAYNITLNFIKKHDGAEVNDPDIQEMLDLQKIWYDSLETNDPAYSVYSSPYYFCEVWLCWVKYSRRYIKDISKKDSLFDKSIVDDIRGISTIMDLGCGFGYTTVGFKETFPECKVYGTNIEGSSQYKMATELGNQYDFSIIQDYTNTKSDLIFASEYFEHFQRPIEHLLDIIKHCEPKYFLIANAFTARAIGHFNEYYYKNITYTGKDMSRLFNETLRVYGYEKVHTSCWNNRPNYWKKSSGLEKFF